MFLALGSCESRRLGIAGENTASVYSGMEFLKAFNLHEDELAKGHVAVIGGGNSALDAARVALRQKNVESVTILYRRTQEEMPAFDEEIKAAEEEGIKVETLVSPIRIHAEKGRLTGVECIRNVLGEMDASGRRKPVPNPGTETIFETDTLIVAIGEQPRTDFLAEAGIDIGTRKNVIADEKTLLTSRPGVFAGGDVATGSNTVVEAIAAGKRAAVVIDRHLRSLELTQPATVQLPKVYIEPVTAETTTLDQAARVDSPTLTAGSRRKTFAEVEGVISEDQAKQEAARCLRCDLDFTQPRKEEEETLAVGGTKA